ncbi:MAG TPA: protein translocase subunit SecD [Actinomycetota bacterium]|nr:protein translocase subunit SecD [Actinomycetota bacterium]
MRSGRPKIYLALSLLVAFGSLAAVLLTDTTPRLGLDLEGGTSVILTAEGENVREDVLQQTVEIIRRRIDALGVAEPEVAISGTDNILIQLPGVENEQQALELIGTTAQLTFRQVERMIPPRVNERRAPEVTEETGPEVNDRTVVFPSGQQGEDGVLYEMRPATLTGEVVDQAEAVSEPTTGQWSVSINMNDRGSEQWASFTSRLACLRDEGEQVRSQVAIVLDGVVESAAGMRSPAEAGGSEGVECGTGITGGDTQIDVGNQAEAKDLALVLRTGALPLTLEQSEVSKVSPTLGRDSLNAGLTAGIIGLALVMAYMILYYRALGLVVWVGLAVFTSVLYTIMALLGESAGLSLSLAGVAGFIVSIGVTADSYIVAFERLKDEAHSGKTLRAAVAQGMTRSFRTILVADFVTGAAAIILFLLAVGPVRGFALTLGLATVADVLIAYYFTRPAVTLLARSRLFSEGRFIGMRAALGVQPS